MAKENKPTVKQHFIPQFYLKNFSEDGGTIWQYNILKDLQTPVAVPIESICYEKNLYEFRDKNNDFYRRNLIEKLFSTYEAVFSHVIESISSKALNDRNFETLSFLTPKEKAILTYFVAIQLLRHPNTITDLENLAYEHFGEDIGTTTAHNLALIACVPIYKPINSEEKCLLNSTLNRISDMSFQIVVSKSDDILTSDFPVYLHGDSPESTIHDIIMPLTSKLALHMKPISETPLDRKNRLVKLIGVRNLNSNTIINAKEWIYSKKQLNKSDIKWIKEVRENCHTSIL